MQTDASQSMFGFAGDTFPGFSEGSANVATTAVHGNTSDVGYDAKFLAALLQEVQPRVENGTESSKVRTRVATPTRSADRSRAASPSDVRAGEEDKWRERDSDGKDSVWLKLCLPCIVSHELATQGATVHYRKERSAHHILRSC